MNRKKYFRWLRNTLIVKSMSAFGKKRTFDIVRMLMMIPLQISFAWGQTVAFYALSPVVHTTDLSTKSVVGSFELRGIQVRGTERQKTAVHPRGKQA